MRRTALALTLVAVAATATACGLGSSSKPVSAAGETASPMAASPTAMMSSPSAMASMSPSAGMGAMMPDVPQTTVMVSAMGMGRVPQGALGAKAVALGLGRDHLPVVTVAADDTSCVPNKVTVTAGRTWFKLVNSGMKVEAMFLESTKGKELFEIGHIAPSAFGGFRVSVKAGGYLIACEPGMGSEQIRTPLKVTEPAGMGMGMGMGMSSTPMMSSAPMMSSTPMMGSTPMMSSTPMMGQAPMKATPTPSGM